jgi:polyhydroxyalkanoate synthesis regulator phasin
LSSKHDIQEALNDRKVALLEDTKQKIQRLEQTVESLSLIKFKPDAFVKSYFDELKRSIDAKAEEARRKIDDDQREMTDLLQKYHDACLSHLKKSGVRFESDTIDSIVARFQSSAGAWHQSVSEPSASENDLVHTNAETESFGKFANNELSKIKLTMFGDKVYELKALSREAVRFGKLVALDGKNLVEVSETHNHLQEGTGSRPINKLIRFDIKGTKRK